VDKVEIQGLTIAYRRAGKGPPLLLLHGGISDGREWRRQIEDLSDEFTVVAWDAPGCGGSSDPPESFRWPDYAACLAAFVDALDLRDPHVLGLSFGSVLALELYRQKPSMPKTLVLASAYAGWAGSLPPEAVKERLEQVLHDVALPPEELVRAWVPTLFTEGTPSSVKDELAEIMSEFHPAGSATLVRSFADADLRDVLPLITVPTLLLYGDRDARAPRDVALALEAAIPRSRLVFMPGVGHQGNMEAPERFNDEVRSFLRSVPS
jgi:pimeloyl-ACP methyl ester carboxylesterase